MKRETLFQRYLEQLWPLKNKKSSLTVHDCRYTNSSSPPPSRDKEVLMTIDTYIWLRFCREDWNLYQNYSNTHYRGQCRVIACWRRVYSIIMMMIFRSRGLHGHGTMIHTRHIRYGRALVKIRQYGRNLSNIKCLSTKHTVLEPLQQFQKRCPGIADIPNRLSVTARSFTADSKPRHCILECQNKRFKRPDDFMRCFRHFHSCFKA